jgi:hypothetical protein
MNRGLCRLNKGLCLKLASTKEELRSLRVVSRLDTLIRAIDKTYQPHSSLHEGGRDDGIECMTDNVVEMEDLIVEPMILGDETIVGVNSNFLQNFP